jgi:lycopene cyclase domain-containing protein
VTYGEFLALFLGAPILAGIALVRYELSGSLKPGSQRHRALRRLGTRPADAGTPPATRGRGPGYSRRFLLVLAGISLVALAYTAPWDNLIVVNGVWSYSHKQILGVVLGHVPLEEYVFYVLQVFLTGILTVLLQLETAWNRRAGGWPVRRR